MNQREKTLRFADSPPRVDVMFLWCEHGEHQKFIIKVNMAKQHPKNKRAIHLKWCNMFVDGSLILACQWLCVHKNHPIIQERLWTTENNTTRTTRLIKHCRWFQVQCLSALWLKSTAEDAIIWQKLEPTHAVHGSVSAFYFTLPILDTLQKKIFAG